MCIDEYEKALEVLYRLINTYGTQLYFLSQKRPRDAKADYYWQLKVDITNQVIDELRANKNEVIDELRKNSDLMQRGLVFKCNGNYEKTLIVLYQLKNLYIVNQKQSKDPMVEYRWQLKIDRANQVIDELRKNKNLL